MDPYTLAYLAGHSDFSTTRRYVHPQADTVRAALERVRAQVEVPATPAS
jgi:site-specific recombinase XerD